MQVPISFVNIVIEIFFELYWPEKKKTLANIALECSYGNKKS
jgi:hypothetical protein